MVGLFVVPPTRMVLFPLDTLTTPDAEIVFPEMVTPLPPTYPPLMTGFVAVPPIIIVELPAVTPDTPEAEIVISVVPFTNVTPLPATSPLVVTLGPVPLDTIDALELDPAVARVTLLAGDAFEIVIPKEFEPSVIPAPGVNPFRLKPVETRE